MRKKCWVLIEYGGDWCDSWERIEGVYRHKKEADYQLNKKENILKEYFDQKDLCITCTYKNNFEDIRDKVYLMKLNDKLLKECPKASLRLNPYNEEPYSFCLNDVSEDYCYDVVGYKLVETKLY